MNRAELEAINKVVNSGQLQEAELQSRIQKMKDSSENKDTKKPSTEASRKAASLEDKKQFSSTGTQVQKETLLSAMNFLREITAAISKRTPNIDSFNRLQDEYENAKKGRVEDKMVRLYGDFLQAFSKLHGVTLDSTDKNKEENESERN
tara:strand:- start:30 stop:476 length:447 start_codon:yes stop_codon:yes gene_type:complete